MNITYKQHHFFILNKGQNAGKPMDKQCQNCFVVITDSTESRDCLFWISYGLWRAAHFHPYLVGSVIPFLRRGELIHILHHIMKLKSVKINRTNRVIAAMKKLHALEERLSLQLHLVDQIRMSHVLNWLKTCADK